MENLKFDNLIKIGILLMIGVGILVAMAVTIKKDSSRINK
jgi:hypothetical protein